MPLSLTIEQRADRAKKALATIPTEHGKPLDALRADERAEAITNLIADLLLYGARDELDPAIVLEDAALAHDSLLVSWLIVKPSRCARRAPARPPSARPS